MNKLTTHLSTGQKISQNLFYTFLLLFMSISVLSAQPANDLCTDAIEITAPPAGSAMTGTGTTLMATTTDFPPDCGTGVENSTVGGVWFMFDAASNTPYTLTTCDSGTNFDTEISVHSITGSGSCMTDLMCQYGNDDAACTFGPTLSTISFTSPTELVGTTYYVYVKGNETATGNFELAVINNTPLPVELISFTGVAERNVNKLNWETASEFNTDSHVLERSLNGSTHWQEVGKVAAVGFTTERQKYVFDDVDPPAKCYYRLLSIDFDGHKDYSKTVYLEQEKRSFEIISIAPNPLSDFLNIDYTQQTNEPTSFTLANMQGQIIRQWTSNAKKGSHQENVNLADFPSGVYFIKMNNTLEVVTRKILKQ